MATQVRQKTGQKTSNGRSRAHRNNFRVAAAEEIIEELIAEGGLHVSETEYWEKYYIAGSA